MARPAGGVSGGWLVLALACALACGLAGCAEGSDESALPDARPRAAEEGAPPRAPASPGFCERAGNDMVRDVFCSGTPPVIDSLAKLQQVLRLKPGPAEASYHADGDIFVRFAAMLGHSTALSGQLVSPINPRALVIGVGTVLAFQRGVQQVELATLARDRRAFNFYLLEFEQACADARGGCTPADLYTARIERDWRSYAVRDDEDLKNTPLDCRQCHQRARDGGIMLMRELTPPWTHFFEQASTTAAFAEALTPSTTGGADLLLDYLAARGEESYANVDVASLGRATPAVLQTAVGADQPLFFDSLTIQQERFPHFNRLYPAKPLPSPTWESAYESFKRGEQLALPYLETRATDPDKQAALTEAYRRYRAGELSDSELPDLADIFPDDPMLRARIGLQTEPDATPQAALIQACGQCHNDVLDQSLSRARFNIDVSRLDASELDLAIERIRLDPDAPGAMPPRGFRQLDPGARERLLEYLRTDARSAAPDPLLVRAAELGMTGSTKASK